MPNLNSPTDIADTLSAPLGELIAAVGRGVADAQQALDEGTLATFKKIYGTKDRSLLAELGYQPTWYKIPEVNAEISVSLSISGEAQTTAPILPGAPAETSKIKLYAAPIDANYTNKYDYDFKAASIIRFKIVPVPPSPQAADMKVVPDLLGQVFSDVKSLLVDLGISYTTTVSPEQTPASSYKVVNTKPKAGEILVSGQVVELTLSNIAGQ